MITYAELYELLRKEKYSEKLQKLTKTFLIQLEAYFQEKKSLLDNEEKNNDSIFSDELPKIRKQLENAKSVVRDIVSIREKKILTLALLAAKVGIDKRDAENMLDHERELLEATTAKIEENNRVIGAVFNNSTQIKEKPLKNQVIRFIQDTPGFLDPNNNNLGPFKKGDVANLPSEIVKILVESGQADMIKQN